MLVKHAKEKGLDGLAITDHNTICGAQAVFDKVNDEQMEFSVIIGEEISTDRGEVLALSLIHISEPTRLLSISYAVFCLKKNK